MDLQKTLQREMAQGKDGSMEQKTSAEDIHTGIFQGKIKNFPGLETPQVRSSYLTVQ